MKIYLIFIFFVINSLNITLSLPTFSEQVRVFESSLSDTKDHHGGESQFVCGEPKNHRQKRYVLMNTKWHNHRVTWRFDHNYGRFYYESAKIRRIISEALGLWQKLSMLTFEEVSSGQNADIVISFVKNDHSEICRQHLGPNVLAHAFQPGSHIGGDIHINEDKNWDFNVIFDQEPGNEKTSLFAVILHELGHSLGLGHSDDPKAVMYKHYSMNTATFSQDDIQGIRHIYGIPRESHNEVQSSAEHTVEHHHGMPDKCNMSYDAIVTLRSELFIFKNKYMWRPDRKEDAKEIRRMWTQLPKNLTHVDAVFEGYKGRIYFFIGNEIYIFEGTNLIDQISLYNIGMDINVKKINAIFRWPYNNRIYIISGQNYYKFDEERNKIEKGYPQPVKDVFRDAFDIDTAFNQNNRLYFFKNEFFYEFDDDAMRLGRMKPQNSAVKFMGCVMPHLLSVGIQHNQDDLDYVMLDDQQESKEVYDHFEKHDKNLNNGESIGVHCILLVFSLIFSLGVSFT